MLRITTTNGQILTDQRGNYLYDGRQGEPVLIQEPLGPICLGLEDMLRFWSTYSEYGTYELHLW
jgi:hypothetical protein